MKTTIKNIKDTAKVIKESGARGKEAWRRLFENLSQYDNIVEWLGWECIYLESKCEYREITGKIISSTYFF